MASRLGVYVRAYLALGAAYCGGGRDSAGAAHGEDTVVCEVPDVMVIDVTFDVAQPGGPDVDPAADPAADPECVGKTNRFGLSRAQSEEGAGRGLVAVPGVMEGRRRAVG